MDASDLRRLALSAVVAAALLLLWLLFLFLHDAGLFRWSWPEAALGAISMEAWLGILAGVAAVLLAGFAVLSMGLDRAPQGLARASTRQVQCQDCKAVFFLRDTGHRPLTHQCPSCRALGVYDGCQEPVGKVPEPQPLSRSVRLDLTCRSCHHRFAITDTGARPLKVTCPACRSVGRIM